METKNSGKPIFFGDSNLSLEEWFGRHDYSTYFVLVDSGTSVYCLSDFIEALPDIDWKLINVPMGEQYKDLSTCRIIWDRLYKDGADRRSVLVNLGGGVVGDMGGFCAGTYMRGIDFVQIPTTLLAMVDSSIGGKLGVDFMKAKNMIGLFREPVATFIDTKWLTTLPENELRNGWAEIIKHTLIRDGAAFNRIRDIDSFLELDWMEWIEHSVSIKKEIVDQDPMEAGLRKGLNYGHTIGHAVESFLLEKEQSIKHGEAVAMGMISESFLSNLLGFLPKEQFLDIVAVINKWFPKITIEKADYEAIIQFMSMDKKNTGGIPNFTLLTQIGQFSINHQPTKAQIEQALEFYRNC